MAGTSRLCRTNAHFWIQAAVLLLIAGLTGCGSENTPGEEASVYVKEIKTWQKQREERLREPTGWLSLAGLYWLEQGRNTFGSDSSNAVVFPLGKAPKAAGVFVLSGDSLTAVIEPGVDIRHGGEPVTSIRMYNDQDADHETTVLEWGSLSWYAIERSGRIGIRLKDSESERLKA
ncbi:MAG: hypothetical protein P8181_10815, partial [bacterium]